MTRRTPEADSFELYALADQDGGDLVIRATQNRGCADGQSLAAVAQAAPDLGTTTVAMRRRPEQPARTARCQVRATPVTLMPPS